MDNTTPEDKTDDTKKEGDIESVRQVCNFFANHGRDRQWQLRQEAIIRNNYPPELVEALGLDFIASLPTLNIKNMEGNTGYIDFLKPKDLGGHPIVRGVDKYGRAFISMHIMHHARTYTDVFTVFQRSSSNKNDWTIGFKGGTPHEIAESLQKPNTLKQLATFEPVDITSLDYIGRKSLKKFRLVVCKKLDTEMIKNSFPGFMIDAIGLDNMCQLPNLPIGEGIHNDYTICFDHNQILGWDSNDLPFICFKIKLKKGNLTKDSNLTLYKKTNGVWASYHKSLEWKDSPDCGLGADLVNPDISDEEKTALLKSLLSLPENEYKAFSSQSLENAEEVFIRLPANDPATVESEFHIEPSIAEIYKQLKDQGDDNNNNNSNSKGM